MLVLITIAILTMMGTALLSMSFMNITMKQNDLRSKKTIYYTESYIEQVYARIGYLVELAIGDAMTATDGELQDILDDVALFQSGVDPVVEPLRFHDVTNVTTYVDVNGDLDLATFEAYADDLYREKFREIMNDFNTDGTVEAEVGYILPTPDPPVNESYKFLDANDASKGATYTIEIANVVGFQPGGHEFVFEDVTSTFLLNGKTEKQIKTDIIISDNLTEYPLSTLEEVIILLDNPIWQKPLVADRDIIFDTSAVQVEGDVYGYGYTPAITDTASPTEYGGVVIQNGNVTVDGSIYSRAYIQLDDGTLLSPKNGNLTVNDGVTYANSLIVQEYANGDILVNNGNVYTKDDLEMNGTGTSSITINGSYFGYSDGSEGTEHDKSSAIVLNSDMTNAELTITGQQLSGVAIDGIVDYKEQFQDPNNGYAITDVNGIVIGGTAYVDTFDSDGITPKRFQTGESVSFKGNYLGYTWGFNEATVLTPIKDTNAFSLSTANRYRLYNTADHDTKIDQYLKRENVDWQTYYSQGATSSVNFGTGSTLTIQYTNQDRAAFFAAFKEYVNDVTPGFDYIATGAGNVVLDNYFYAAGIQLGNDTGLSRDFEYITENFDEFDLGIRPKIGDDYLYQLHNMSYRNWQDTSTITDVMMASGASMVIASPTVDNANAFEKYTNLDVNSYSFWEEVNTAYILNPSLTAGEIRHISDSTDALHIYAPGSTADTSLNYVTVGNTYNQGVIARTGDIHIYGNFEFAGTIITDGSIYTHDGLGVSSQKFMNNNELIRGYIARMIYFDVRLYDIFQVINYGGGGTPSIGLVNKEFLKRVEPAGTTDPANNNMFTYYDWINFKYWRVTK